MKANAGPIKLWRIRLRRENEVQKKQLDFAKRKEDKGYMEGTVGEGST